MFESQLLRYIAFGVLSYIETYILWFFFDVFLHKNQRRDRHVWAGKTVYFVFQCLTYVLYLPLFSSALPTYFLAIAITLIFFDDEIYFKALTVHIFVFLSYSCRTFALAGTLSFLSPALSGHPFPVLPSYVQGLSCILALMATWGLRGVQRLRKKGHILVYESLFAVAPAVFLVSLIILFRLEMTGERSSMSYYWGSAICLLVVTLILFYHLDKVTIIHENKLHSRLAQSLLEEDKKRFTELVSQQQETLRIKHDIRQHLQTLQYMFGENNIAGARGYLEQVLAQKALNKQLFTTGNPIIDSLLSQKIPHIQSQGIEVQFNLMIPPALPLEDMDLCVLLSNLLINAQEACMRMEEAQEHQKCIHLQIVLKKNFLMIDVENTFDGQIAYENGRYLSTKKNVAYSGIGLSNVASIVDKYQGMMDISHQTRAFRVQIMLPV